MKKFFVLPLVFILLCVNIYAHINTSIDITDDIYSILSIGEAKGFCDFLPGSKPYSLKRILFALDQILEHEDELKEVEVTIINDFIAKHTIQEDSKNSATHVSLLGNIKNVPVNFLFDFSMDSNASGGLYTDSDFNQFGFDIMPNIFFRGDVSPYFSYMIRGVLDVSYMPLYEQGNDYLIGYSWYEDGVEEFLDGDYQEDGSEYDEPHRRTIKTFVNTSYLPYSYKKRWDGQFYLLSNLSASGTEGWATELGFSGTIEAEMRASVLDGRLTVGGGRISREWAGMDNGSSLVLSSSARPFFSVDMTLELFPFLKYSSLTGVLEYPNQDYMNEDSYAEDKDGVDDSYFYQNAFSLNMLELDFKYFHFDFGSSAVWPKRFELGYMFPLINYVEYQNHIGDSDNLALFGDIKVRKPGLGSIWASLYLDEINGLNNDPFTSSRAMFAGQLGSNVVIPWLPFTTISMRYTKVEPYCYTHHSINYSSSYSHYISENYTSGGACLGYYLPPNSDEFLFKLESKPKSNLAANIKYQFIRHGADYGSQQVPGSSLYSELPIYNRDELEKYFLHDGAYNWMHIVSVGGSVEVKKSKTPFKLYGNVGFLYSYYTVIDDDVYKERHEYGNNGNCGDRYSEYHFIDSDEYPVECGVVLTLGVAVFRW